MDPNIESLFIEINKELLNTDKNVLIGTIYRPPDTDTKEFINKFQIIIESIHRENKWCYLMGDFNINLMNCDTHNLTGEFYDLMTSFVFLPTITRSTRITHNSATLIDNIFQII